MELDEINKVVEKLLSTYNTEEIGILISLLSCRYMDEFDASKAEFMKSLANSIDIIKNNKENEKMENVMIEKHLYNIDGEKYIIYLFPTDNNFTDFYIEKKGSSLIDYCISVDMKKMNCTNAEFIDENIVEWIKSYKYRENNDTGNGIKISYDCEDLIDELKEDIEERGNFDAYAFFEEVEGHQFLTNYDFIEEEKPIESKEFKPDTIVAIMKAKEILKILEEQNRII